MFNADALKTCKHRLNCLYTHTHTQTASFSRMQCLLFSYSFIEWENESENSPRKYASLLFPVTRHLCAMPFHSHNILSSLSLRYGRVCFFKLNLFAFIIRVQIIGTQVTTTKAKRKRTNINEDDNDDYKKSKLCSKNQNIMVSKVFCLSCIHKKAHTYYYSPLYFLLIRSMQW